MSLRRNGSRVGVRLLALFAVAGLAATLADDAQVLRAQGPTFEVASIRPNNSGGLYLTGVQTLPGGTVRAEGLSLRSLIAFAYGLNVRFERVEGKFDRQLDQQFDLTAKAGTDLKGVPMGEVGPINLMMQQLLADRFKLVVRTESREESGFALVRARSDKPLGPRMQPAEPCSTRDASGSPAAGARRTCAILTANNELNAPGVNMGSFAGTLLTQLRRPVADKTGLSGFFDIQLTFDQAELAQLIGFRVKQDPTLNLPSLFVALQEQLGLELRAERVTVRTLIVERLEPLSPN